MAGKFFRVVALLMILTSSLSFAAKNKKNKYSIKTSDGGVIAEGRLKQKQLKVPDQPVADNSSLESVPAEEAADSSSLASEPAPAETVVEAEDHKESRYEISAIEEPAAGLNYYIAKDENNQYSFIQKLSWNKINDIKNYRITIERSTDAGWVPVLEKDLTENRIEVSLEAGQYRFQVSVINLFDQLEKSSSWRNFEVLKALQPKIETLQTDSMYLSSKKADGIFTLNGSNLNEHTIFTMEKKDVEPPKILRGKVLSLSPDGNSAQVQFDISEMQEGKYEIYAQNPGGLSVISKTLHIKNKKDKKWRLTVGGGYSFALALEKNQLTKYTQKQAFPLTGTAKIAIIPLWTKFGDFGFSAIGNYSFMIPTNSRAYKLTGNLATALGCLTYQKYVLPKKLLIDVHAGAGMASIFGLSFENKSTGQKSPALNSVGLAFGGGLGLQYHFAKHLYVEAAADYVYCKFQDMSFGMIYPSASFGGRF